MFSQAENNQKCAVCNSTEFYKEDGYYFCSKCQTQNDDIREEVFEYQFDPSVRLRKTKIRSEKTKDNDVIGWTSWELYNFVLIGLVNELVQIGVDRKIKLTILQLWTSYLSKLDVAFTSKTKKCVPRMSRRYHKKDAQIIYGKVRQEKKKKRRRSKSNTSASSLMSSFTSEGTSSKRALGKNKKLLAASEYSKSLLSQESSDTDALSSFNQSFSSAQSSNSGTSNATCRIRFNKRARLESQRVRRRSLTLPASKKKQYAKSYTFSQYNIGPDVLTPIKLWSIIYIALRIEAQDIHISDMLRFCREGHLSYYKLDHLLPPEVSLTRSDAQLLTQRCDITHKGLRRAASGVAKFLMSYEFANPSIWSLIDRYCTDLDLPKGVASYAQRLFLKAPAVMKFSVKSPLIPNYEGRAMAYIIVVLKTLFGLDDVTEREISRIVEKIDGKAIERNISTAKLFSFCEWQRYLECRKRILSTVHFPSKVKYDPECVGSPHLYLRFTSMMKSKSDAEPPEITSRKHMLSENLVNAMSQCIQNLNDSSIPLKEMEVFPPSLIPCRSYVTQLADNPRFEIPSILMTNFNETKVGYMTKPDLLIRLAAECDIHLEVVDHSLQYFEKIVPAFEQYRLPDSKELGQVVEVIIPDRINRSKQKSQSLLDYSHRNRACKMKVNFDCLKHYSEIRSREFVFDETLEIEDDSFFNQISPDGKLKICEDSDSDNEDEFESSQREYDGIQDSSCLLQEEFCKKYEIKLYDHEVESLLNVKKTPKEERKIYRDIKGKFVKASSEGHLQHSQENEDSGRAQRVTKNQSSKSKSSSSRKSRYKMSETDDSGEEVVEVPFDCFDESDSEISILNDLKGVSLTDSENLSMKDREIIFRPYKDYWMYHCLFGRVKGKDFELFEKELPENFLWLLSECADAVEMTTEDLYEEVCLIEAYHLNILGSDESKDADYDLHKYNLKSYSNNVFSKW
ncbi:hypothetical protein QAD02_019920 [Eretmocerus hayati]|uniref:Uncharacterized protein n=1 Tax=Eretmocerus hayati TaxID=131215 RepID=A0ACC2PKX9_9HYME|nr:hypothetical protein QAD02_019920 [Eretmocerus hayati]